MKIEIEVEAPFACCSMCDRMQLKEHDIYGDFYNSTRYICKFYHVCEEAVRIHRNFQGEDKK